MSPPKEHTLIRQVSPNDSPSLSQICLLTADAGTSAARNHSENPGADFPGNVYAVPYAHMKNTFGFVVVAKGGDGDEEVVGYILGATDTRAFEAEVEQDWYPALRRRFPLSLAADDATDVVEHTSSAGSTTVDPSILTPEDRRYFKLFHKPDTAYDNCVKFSPAHLHINVLPEYQRQGWGRRLIDTAVRHLNKEGRSADERKLEGVWLCMDPRNKEAANFYERVGFEGVEGAPETCVGVRFEKWLKRYGE